MNMELSNPEEKWSKGNQSSHQIEAVYYYYESKIKLRDSRLLNNILLLNHCPLPIFKITLVRFKNLSLQ